MEGMEQSAILVLTNWWREKHEVNRGVVFTQRCERVASERKRCTQGNGQKCCGQATPEYGVGS